VAKESTEEGMNDVTSPWNLPERYKRKEKGRGVTARDDGGSSALLRKGDICPGEGAQQLGGWSNEETEGTKI